MIILKQSIEWTERPFHVIRCTYTDLEHDQLIFEFYALDDNPNTPAVTIETKINNHDPAIDLSTLESIIADGKQKLRESFK